MLVIEYGEIEYAPGVFDPPSTLLGEPGNSASFFLFQSPPVPDVKNRTALVLAGKAVGGSSTVNGMFFDRGSQTDHDAWSALGSPQFDANEDKWDWASIYPYFQKVVEHRYIQKCELTLPIHPECNIYRSVFCCRGGAWLHMGRIGVWRLYSHLLQFPAFPMG